MNVRSLGRSLLHRVDLADVWRDVVPPARWIPALTMSCHMTSWMGVSELPGGWETT